jgi:predicted glycoside hydrolase/deacetylase ChbG (UPF0249 family)
VRRLIVNADDFGLTIGVNHAIVESHQRGIVSSTTLMASARAFNDAVTIAPKRAGPRPFSVGCHVVLLDGEPLVSPEKVASLLKSGTKNGHPRLRDKMSEFALAVLTGRIKPEEVEAEATAQMQRIQSSGIPLSHFDAHKHAHMFPAVLRPLLRAARELGVPAVRNPFGKVFPLPFGKLLGKYTLWTRFAEMSVLRNFAASFQSEVRSHGLRTPDGSLGVLVTGVLDLDLFTTIANAIPEGTWEFVCHPGYNDAELDGIRTRLRQSREQELSVLTSVEARQALERRDIELISYHEL